MTDHFNTDDFYGLDFEVDGIRYRRGYDRANGELVGYTNVSRQFIELIDDNTCAACVHEDENFTNPWNLQKPEHEGVTMFCGREIDWKAYWRSGLVGDGDDIWETI